jgi:tricorn protease
MTRLARRAGAARLAGLATALVLAAGAPVPAAAAEPESTRGLRFPSITPDGKTVVFAWRGDVWRAPVAGGAAVRLTIHEAQDTKPRVSPDGTRVAFTSRRGGSYDVYVMPLEGGEPRQVTFHSATDVATDWSPDGRRLLFLSSRDATPYQVDLYEVDVEGGTPRRVTRDGGRDGAYSPDGAWVVYTRGYNTIYQDAYKGSANYDLYVVALSGGTPRRLTRTDGNELSPAFSASGDAVYYVAPQGGRLNFFSIPAQGGEPKALTRFADDDVRRPTLSWDRKTAVFERDGRLWRVDLAAAEPRAEPIDVRVESDVRNAGIDVRTVTGGGEHPCVSPDGSQVAFSLRGDLWVMPASGGEGTQLTRGPGADEWPRWSPDGRRLAYASNARGNSDLYVLEVSTKQSKQVTTNPKDDFFHSWSPDGRRLVFSSERTGNRDLFTVDLESGEESQLTRDPAADDDPAFSPDGKWIAFDSARGGAQAIYVMPSSPGGERQARKVSPGAGPFQVPSWSPDGSMLVFEEFDPAAESPGGLWVVRSTGGPAVQVSRDGQSAWWGRDWIYFSAERGGESGIWRVKPPTAIEAGERLPFLGKVSVDRRTEFGELFDEAWQRLRDGFYDAKMHGVDWDALKKKYRPLAVDADVRDEFYAVVSQMLGELDASHLGIYGPREADEESPDAPPTGYLGLELEAGAAPGGGRRVASVQPKGPAFDAHLRVGDVLVSVGGTALEASTDLDRVLAGAAGKDVKLVYRPGDGSEERTETVKAASAAGISRIKYDLWVERSKERVAERTKEEAGYLHLSRMDPSNLARFNAAIGEMNKQKKKGLVLDVRNNGGGNIHQQLLDVLAKRPFIAFQSRNASERQVQPSLYWGKPVVVLVNERSFSDAEVFPYAFKQLGLGKVVGVPTAGGVIGTTDVTLSDGTRFRIPRVGWYGLSGENLERLGVKPDVVVEETSEDRLAGRDPQLEKAIDVLLEDMARAAPPPVTEPKPEPVPEAAPTPAPTPVPPERNPTALDERPFDDVVVGEWAAYAVSLPDAAKELTLRVASVGPDVVSVTGEPAGLVTALGFPAETPRRALKELLQGVAEVWGAKDPIAAPKTETSETSAFTGPVLVYEVVDGEGRLVRLEFSHRVPVFGLVRATRDGKTILEIKGFEGNPAAASARGG